MNKGRQQDTNQVCDACSKACRTMQHSTAMSSFLRVPSVILKLGFWVRLEVNVKAGLPLERSSECAKDRRKAAPASLPGSPDSPVQDGQAGCWASEHLSSCSQKRELQQSPRRVNEIFARAWYGLLIHAMVLSHGNIASTF